MFSYRHAFHAGNHADVLKHTVLLAALDHLLQKDTALALLDTHAGNGLYRLDGDFAQTSGESQHGIQKLLWAYQPASASRTEISQIGTDAVKLLGLPDGHAMVAVGAAQPAPAEGGPHPKG